MAARRSTASGKVTPSDCMTKSKMLPFLPDEKSNQACFWSLTKNDAVFSLLNGDRPLYSRPERVSLTRLPTTSDTGSRAFSSSRNCGVKRMKGCDRIGCAHHRPARRAIPGRGGMFRRLAGNRGLILLFHRRNPCRLLRLHPGVLDHLRCLAAHPLDLGGELLRRADRRHQAAINDMALLEVGLADDTPDFGIEPVDDRLRRAGRRE